MKEHSTPPRTTEPAAGPLPAAFFALLFFLGCADLDFATRLKSMNFRWGQVLLLVGLVATARPLYAVLTTPGERRRTLTRLLAVWALFFGVYALASGLSAEPKAGLVKLLWGVVNIGGAAVVCLVGARRKEDVLEGFAVATAVTSAVIWVDALVLYWVQLPGPFLGQAQVGYVFDGIRPTRPQAFYYEPSYAGAMLAFAVPVLFVATATLPRWARVLIPAMALSAGVLCGARTGLLGVMLSLGLCVAWALANRERAALRPVAASVVAATVMMAVFFTAPRASTYGLYLSGPLGMAATTQRLIHKSANGSSLEAGTSEGARLASFADGLRRWRENPVLGSGVNNGSLRAIGRAETDRAIHTGAPNTWIEVLVESGALGFLSFGFAIGFCLWVALRARPRVPLWGFLMAGCVTHLLINLNMTQTFPRLDYWLLFFCVVRAALPEAAAATVEAEAPAVGLIGAPAHG